MKMSSRQSSKRVQQLSLARGKRKISDGLPSEMPSGSASERKLSMGNQGVLDISQSINKVHSTQQWLLVHVARLNELIGDLTCPNCGMSGLKINIDLQNQGFCSSLLLECCLCKDDKYRRSVYTSTRLRDESRNDVAFDVNVRMVLLAHELGLGYAALRKISKVLGLPGLHLKTYQRHGKRVTGRLWKQGCSLSQKLKQSVEFLMSEIAQHVWLLPPCNI